MSQDQKSCFGGINQYRSRDKECRECEFREGCAALVERKKKQPMVMHPGFPVMIRKRLPDA